MKIKLFYINIDLPTPRSVIKVRIYYYRAYQICLKIINLWGNKKKIFYKIEGIDKPFILEIPNIAKKGIFINIMILL